MTKLPKLFLAIVALAAAAYGHFTFVVPQAGGRAADLFLSETLRPDGQVSVHIVKDTKLMLRDESGQDTALSIAPGEKVYTLDLPGKGDRIVHGIADLGISAAGPSKKPYLLVYHPKTLVGSLFGEKATLGADQPVDLVPIGVPGKVSLLMLVRGKAHANSDVTVILPDNTQKVVKTDAQGLTPVFEQTGRYGAWARFWEPGTGTRDGKPYEEIRHYATLVFDAFPKAAVLPALPEATASFGAAVANGWLYVYGGHIAKTHLYDTNAVSGKFYRINLETQQREELPSGPAMQGMNIAAHRGKIYRIGGMTPRNAPGEKQTNASIPDVARYDPATKTWENLPALPEGRSSHDVVVIGDQLIVAGGWTLRDPEKAAWAGTMVIMDLAAPTPAWRTSSQPFQRRALIAAVHDGKMYVMGGIQPNNAVSTDVDIYDPSTSAWSKGPKLPTALINSFAPAAVDHDGQLYVNLGDGGLYRLDDAAGQWRDAGKTSPRVAHRMISSSQGILILGGATGGNNLSLVESVALKAGVAR